MSIRRKMTALVVFSGVVSMVVGGFGIALAQGQIDAIPMTGGASDIARLITVIGVITTGVTTGFVKVAAMFFRSLESERSNRARDNDKISRSLDNLNRAVEAMERGNRERHEEVLRLARTSVQKG